MTSKGVTRFDPNKPTSMLDTQDAVSMARATLELLQHGPQLDTALALASHIAQCVAIRDALISGSETPDDAVDTMRAFLATETQRWKDAMNTDSWRAYLSAQEMLRHAERHVEREAKRRETDSQFDPSDRECPTCGGMGECWANGAQWCSTCHGTGRTSR